MNPPAPEASPTAASSPTPHPSNAPGASTPSLRWLSRDYTELRRNHEERAIDVLIVGSGYGGAMAAAELAGLEVEDNGVRRAIRVCVLERGKEYVPGMFASSLQELPPQVRVHQSGHDQTLGPLDALLDVRLGPDVSTLVGNGLGGTSLINAGVMEKPRLDQCERLPRVLRDDLTEDAFEHVKQRLGASTRLDEHPRVPAGGLPKTQALRALERAARTAGVDGTRFRPAAITVQVARDEKDPDVPPCTLCGDCMTGCNVGAKKSLDTTLLREAWRKGAEIYTGGSVLKLRKLPRGTAKDPQARWSLTTVFTDESLRRRHGKVEIAARHVVLAAGTLGSTEILLRSRSYALPLSKKLGEQFSCNGDNLVAVQEQPLATGTTSEEHTRLGERTVGPTITAVLEMERMLVQEFAVPAPLKRVFEETVTTARLLNDLDKPPALSAANGSNADSFGIDPGAMGRTLLVGLIGHDESCGQVQLPDPKRVDDSRHLEGRVRVNWPGIRKSHLLDQGFAAARSVAQAALGPDVPFLPNPLWRLLPEEMEFLVKGERGPVLTVHPLGGCPMGETPAQGVVDDCGRVFDPEAKPAHGGCGVHEGLVVLDGSILPASLGANPALTIATIARRAAGRLAAEWGYAAAGTPVLRPLRRRPVYRAPEHCTPPEPQPTEVELVERLIGPAGPRIVELTLSYEPAPVATLISGKRPKLAVVPQRSLLRVYRNTPDTLRQLITWSETRRDDEALVVARVRGDLDMLRQDPARGLRWVGALGAWFVNRGTREIHDAIFGHEPSRLTGAQLKASAMRAAEARCFDYHVSVERIVHAAPGEERLLRVGDAFEGKKRLTYGLWSNPWRQLTEMKLTRYPWGRGRLQRGDATLRLDGRFLARQGFPLVRVSRQENQIVALADLAAWGMCWVRMLVSIHLWSFRAPDPAPARRPQLLPPEQPPALPLHRQLLYGLLRWSRLPAPEIHEIPLEAPRNGVPVVVRLTRYVGRDKDKPPIALIHGYSASGTTFTHEAIPKPLALYLHEKGHDVWVVDLRTSAGLPSGRLPWHFEDAALADIPVAIARIRAVTQAPRVDVFAHCIGALMLSVALLTHPSELWKFDLVEPADGGPRPKRHCQELRALREGIGRIVLSQKAPNLVYSDDNVLRAYFMRVLRRLILPEDYQFNVPREQQGVAGGLLDRVLSTMPYPDAEFRRENPFWSRRTPWAGFRHRMDALYARDFSLENLSDRTLASIHDLFGPLNLETVAQAIHFARLGTVTDGAGRAIDTQAATLAQRWPRHGTLLIHGEDNGLAHLATTDVFATHMQRAGLRPVIRRIAGYGHQDCLIGRRAAKDVFIHITEFLEASHDEPETRAMGDFLEQPGPQAG